MWGVDDGLLRPCLGRVSDPGSLLSGHTGSCRCLSVCGRCLGPPSWERRSKYSTGENKADPMFTGAGWMSPDLSCHMLWSRDLFRCPGLYS